MITPVPNLTVSPYALAVELRARALESGGADGLAAYEWFVAQVLANPGATQTQAQTAYTTWSNANGNLIYFANWVKGCIARLPAGYAKTWAGLKLFIATKPLAAWLGQATELAEGYRVKEDVTRQDFRGKTVEMTAQTDFYFCPMDEGTTLITNGFGYQRFGIVGEPGAII